MLSPFYRIMIKDNKIIDSISALIGLDIFKETALLIQYGNLDSTRDIDLCLILPDDLNTNNFTLGKLDLFVLNKSLFLDLVSMLDPIITEPLYTGDLIIGSESDFSSLKEKLINTKPNDRAIRHLVLRAFETLLSGESFFNFYLNDKNPENLKKTFNNLAFSISYASFARYYSINENIITLDKLIESKSIELTDFWEYRNRVKTGQIALQPKELSNWLKIWRNNLIDIEK